MTRRRLHRFPRRFWTKAEDGELRKRYPHESTAAVAAALNRTVCAVNARADKFGLRKTAAYLASSAACRLRRGDNVGASFRFKKGQAPANKGLRRPGWHAGRMKETQFKKGVATNWHPVGSTRLVDGYLYRKVSDVRNVPWTRNWRQEHYLVWEAANGPIPKGHNVAFKNRDRTDIRLDNLELISRREQMARNTVHNLPKPLAQTVQLLGALNRQIRKRTRANGSQEQDRRSA